MADDKQGREDQARSADRRRQARDIAEQLERGDETEPPIEATELEYFEGTLESLSFPATGAEIVERVGDHTIETTDNEYSVADLVPDDEAVAFEEPAVVRTRVQRPTVARALKTILEASTAAASAQLQGSQWEAYEKTLRTLARIDADDDDEGIQVITDWIVERLEEKGKLPGSRAVRKRAAEFCRSNGYEIRDDQWLGA